MRYIWLKNEEKNSYAEFKETFISGGGEIKLKISVDFKFAAYVNGKFAANGQYADLPDYKVFGEYDISAFAKKGENEIVIKACHMGVDHFVCRTMPACVAFEVIEEGKTVCASSESTLCRRDARYSAGDLLTPQIGEWYNYSFTAPEEPWGECKVVRAEFKEFPKPIKNTVIGEKVLCDVTAQGAFKFNGGETSAEIIQKAWLSSVSFSEATGGDKTKNNGFIHPLTFTAEGGDGVYIVGDLKKERAGYTFFSVECEQDTVAYFGWGEHLIDLRPRTLQGVRNFAIKINLKKGVNDFSEYMRRIGCRYFILFVCAPSVKISELGIREELYPFAKPEKDFGDRLLNRIYETGRRTLELCAHEHYEDCPWREQSLYGMDSRNQMLFGYGAFGEYEFPRASLRLFAKSLEKDGLLPICPPSQATITIPSFSAYWLLAVYENAEADYDEGFVKEVLPAVETILGTFMANTENGALNTLDGDRYWNFHEWSDGLAGGMFYAGGKPKRRADGILTALVYGAAKRVSELEERVGNTEKAKEFAAYAEELFKGFDRFYDEEKGLFASYVSDGKKIGYHEYTQTAFLALSDGRLGSEKTKKLCEAIKNPQNLVPITLAGLVMKYEGLIKYGGEIDFVINDIVRVFGGMVYEGATSFWETEKGAEDFEGAGSLCHGWSAVACYVLDKYYKKP